MASFTGRQALPGTGREGGEERIDPLLLATGHRLPLAVPVLASLVLGGALFLAPDLVTKINAAEKRADFRHALPSDLDQGG